MMNKSQYNQNNDYQVPTVLSDSISSLAVNGNATTPTNLLLAGAWDNTLSCFEIQRNSGLGGGINVINQGQIRHDAPVLCCDIASDGVTSFSAGCDGQIRMWNVTQGANPQAIQVIGKHDQPVSDIKFLPEKNILLSSSWDKTVKVWDCRQPNPVQVFTVSERIYAMDAKGDALVFGTADKAFHVYNLANMSPMASYKSTFQYQLRSITIFADREGFAAGCIEGRVAIEYFNELEIRVRQSNAGPMNQKLPNMKSFMFKCHRHDHDIFSINSIDFYKNNCLVTAGSDGTFSYWSKDNKLRMGMYEQFKGKAPITKAKFAPYGDMMFYSLSYDWSKGISGNSTQSQNIIMIHPIVEAEMIPNKKT